VQVNQRRFNLQSLLKSASDLVLAEAPELAVYNDLDVPVTLARIEAGETVPYLPAYSMSTCSTVIARQCCCYGRGGDRRVECRGRIASFLIAQSVVASSADEFIKAARLAFSRLVLMEECKLTRIKGIEKLFPADPFQPDIVIAAGLIEVDSENASAALISMRLNLGRVPASRSRPAANFIVIGGLPGTAHGLLLAKYATRKLTRRNDVPWT
jgi:hypothetical protein